MYCDAQNRLNDNDLLTISSAPVEVEASTQSVSSRQTKRRSDSQRGEFRVIATVFLIVTGLTV